MIHKLLVLLFLTAILPNSAYAQKSLDIALIVGNNKHLEQPDRTLQYADDDALMAWSFFELMHPQGRGWLLINPDEDTRQHLGKNQGPYPPPESAHWEQTISDMQRFVQESRSEEPLNVRLFVHFSGHGEPGGALHLQNRLLLSEEFRQSLGEIGADEVFALLDGCHLGQTVKGEGETGNEADVTVAAPPIFVFDELAVPTRPPWLAVIGSTTVVPEHSYLQAGLLSLVGLTALRGPADWDGDEKITFDEWRRYVEDQLGQLDGAPSIVAVPMRRDPLAVVVDLKESGAGGLALPGDVSPAQIRVRNEAGDLVADFYHRGGRATTLRLPPGTYTIWKIGDRNSWDYDGIPAGRIERTIGSGLVELAPGTRFDSVVMVAEGTTQRGAFPSGVTKIDMPIEDYYALEMGPFRTGGANRHKPFPGRFGVATTWGPAGQGPKLATDDFGGAMVNFGLFWHKPTLQKRRWMLALGPGLELNSQHYDQIHVEGTGLVADPFLHSLRLGAQGALTWVGPKVSATVTGSLDYAPGVVLSELQYLGSVPQSDVETLCYLYLIDFGAGLKFSLGVPIGDAWQIGPNLSLFVLNYRPVPGSIHTDRPYMAHPQISAGISLSQRFYRPL